MRGCVGYGEIHTTGSRGRANTMFDKEHLDALYGEIRRKWYGTPEYDRLLRDAHLGVAYSDAGRPLDDIDPTVVALIEKHRPSD